MFKKLKNLIGSILFLSCIGLGIYVGFWLMFVGGIVQVIDSVKYDTNALGIAVGLARIWFSGFVGYLSALACGAIGVALIDK